MAVLISLTLSPTPNLAAAPISKLFFKSTYLQPKSFTGPRIVSPLTKNKGSTSIVSATEIDGVGPVEGGEPPAETEKTIIPVDQLPLESKEKERMEQKEKMRLARKIRLRRKRLVMKRKLRKKGRWPPSKMKRLKNV